MKKETILRVLSAAMVGLTCFAAGDAHAWAETETNENSAASYYEAEKIIQYPLTEIFTRSSRSDRYADLISDVTPAADLTSEAADGNWMKQTPMALCYMLDIDAPKVAVHDLEGYSFEITKVEPKDFIDDVEDVNDVTVVFETEPNLSMEGAQTVRLIATDAAGNTSETEAVLTIIFDKTPPTIEGVKELTVEIGDGVSYKGDITVTDDLDENVSLQVDNSAVDLDTPGDYEVVYRAEDFSGNVTEVTTTLHVISKQPEGVTEEVVNAAADAILAKITTPEMSQYEVIKAIYDWVHNNVRYVDGSVKDNWVQGAYEGLINYAGDCYVYAMTSKCLLTRAGITNMDIEKIHTNGKHPLHYWNLVDIGEGWHHFDTTRRADGSTFFYVTDEELMEYSNTHDDTHGYDRSLYPTIP